MEGFMSYFGGRRDPNKSARDAIIGLKQQLTVLEKKEEFLHQKIDVETKKAKANAVSNKAGAFAFELVPIPYSLNFVARREPTSPDHD
jgi:charged multivesicular body protein 4